MSERIHTDADLEEAPPPEEEDLPAAEPLREPEPEPEQEGEDEDLPPAASAEALEQRLHEAEARADQHLDDLRRLAAEFDNFRKRAAREQESFLGRANERLVKELLPVLDDLERALDAAAKPPVRDSGPGEGVWGNREVPPANDAAFAKLEEGVRLVHRALAEVLRKEGVAEIATDGHFDPHVHEALLAQPSEAEEGAVIEVIQKGYRLGDRVLRPSRVVVSAAKEG